MSDDWRVPDDLADRVRRLDRTDAWKREIERTAEVRAILSDLIAELRELAVYLDSDLETQYAEWARGYADRAEARLKGLTDE